MGILRSTLIELLAPTLGAEKSEEVVAIASKKLGLGVPEEYRADQANAVMLALEQMEGIVGVVARYARARAEMLAERDEEPPVPSSTRPSTPVERPSRVSASPPKRGTSVPPPSPSLPPPSPNTPSTTRVRLDDMLAILVPALGDAKSRDAVASYAAANGMRGDDFSRAEALRMLESMASTEGILAVIARFAKAQFILRFPA